MNQHVIEQLGQKYGLSPSTETANTLKARLRSRLVEVRWTLAQWEALKAEEQELVRMLGDDAATAP